MTQQLIKVHIRILVAW